MEKGAFTVRDLDGDLTHREKGLFREGWKKGQNPGLEKNMGSPGKRRNQRL